MNTILRDLVWAVDDAKDILSQREDDRNAFLDPILAVFGFKSGHVSYCSIDADKVNITRSGSCRGSEWNDDYSFPLAIFTSDDPIQAATEYVAEKAKAERRAARNNTLAQNQTTSRTTR